MKHGTETDRVRVRLKKRYDDTGYTGRIVEAGTEGDAYLIDGGDQWRVRVINQPWGDGEIIVITRNLEFLE